jgi:hypothetical protein
MLTVEMAVYEMTKPHAYLMNLVNPDKYSINDR